MKMKVKVPPAAHDGAQAQSNAGTLPEVWRRASLGGAPPHLLHPPAKFCGRTRRPLDTGLPHTHTHIYIYIYIYTYMAYIFIHITYIYIHMYMCFHMQE